jgi:hypothetical protein
MPKEAHPIETKKWSHKYDRCVACELTKYPHILMGFCSRCYNLAQKKKGNERTSLLKRLNQHLVSKQVFSDNKMSNAEERKPIKMQLDSLTQKPWSLKYDRCIKCGDDETRHIAQGLCLKCYQRNTESKDRNEGMKHKLYYSYLCEEYINKKRSLNDIAKDCNCTRQNVFKAMKQWGIPFRDKTVARTLALQKGKIVFKKKDEEGSITEIVANKITVNEKFFSSWSSKMAYVLGVIYTDGNLCIVTQNDRRYRRLQAVKRLSISQKEPELLEKVLKLMHCNSKLIFRKERVYANTVAGAIYTFNLHEEKICDDLLRIGLTPNKSKTIAFPDMPEECLRHFIRGCWDGDGSVSITQQGHVNTKPRIVASFTSGSKLFIESMAQTLEKAGLPKRNIYRDKESRTGPAKLDSDISDKAAL